MEVQRPLNISIVHNGIAMASHAGDIIPGSTTFKDVVSSTSAFPLTTTFTPPAACLAPTYTLAPAGLDWHDVVYVANASSFVYDITRAVDSSCYPPNFAHLATGSIAYSPGVCPQAYTTGVTSVSADVTYAICCPS